MKAKCRVTIDFTDGKNAQKILKSIEQDNLGYVKTKVISNKIIAEIQTDSIPSMINTLDDYLACINVADKIVDKN